LYNDDDDDDEHDVILYDDVSPEPCIPRSSSEDETIVGEDGIDNNVQTIPFNLDEDSDEYIKSIL